MPPATSGTIRQASASTPPRTAPPLRPPAASRDETASQAAIARPSTTPLTSSRTPVTRPPPSTRTPDTYRRADGERRNAVGFGAGSASVYHGGPGGPSHAAPARSRAGVMP